MRVRPLLKFNAESTEKTMEFKSKSLFSMKYEKIHRKRRIKERIFDAWDA